MPHLGRAIAIIVTPVVVSLERSSDPLPAFLLPSSSVPPCWGGRPSRTSPPPHYRRGRAQRGRSFHSSSPAAAGTACDNHDEAWRPEDWTAALTTQSLETFDGRPVVVRDVVGTLPLDFPHGVLYKAGPARFECSESGTPYAHWLEGDGAISRLELDPRKPSPEEQAKFSFRFVETELYRREREAGRILARGTFGTGKDGGRDAFDLTLRNPCNTNAVKIGRGRGEQGEGGAVVLALSEVGLPSRLDPLTLDTTGIETFGGRLTEGAPAATVGLGPGVDALLGFGDAVSPHYRVAPSSPDSGDPGGGEKPARRITFAALRQNALTSGTVLRLLEVDSATGSVASEVRSVLDETGFPPHDWTVTENYAAFVATPAGGDLTPYILGRRGPAECIAFRAGETASVYLVPRHTSEERGAAMTGAVRDEDAIRIRLPVALHPVHFANSWELQNNSSRSYKSPPAVEIIATCWDDDTVRRMANEGEALLGSWARVKGGDFRGVPAQRLTRITTGDGSGSSSRPPTVEEAAPGLGHVDYVKCHPNWNGRASRFVWGSTAARDPADGSEMSVAPPQAFFRVDLQRGVKEDAWFAGPRRFVDDFVLIAKPPVGGDAGVLGTASEDDGESRAWLLAPVFDAARNASSFVLLDGDDLAAGPVFEARLDRHVPWGLHGFWSPLE